MTTFLKGPNQKYFLLVGAIYVSLFFSFPHLKSQPVSCTFLFKNQGAKGNSKGFKRGFLLAIGLSSGIL